MKFLIIPNIEIQRNIARTIEYYPIAIYSELLALELLRMNYLNWNNY
ncbi:hypothetical protein HYD97_02880 [Mycoplasmopsis bovis]|nr:hypothetical protein [Mycoplasmopsis bovis]QQH34460.1 hypothetical protein HYD97_02880 [Mycoplasmopsis bovis]